MNDRIKFFLLCFALLIHPFTRTHAQNLVLNPSFEAFSSCPLGPSEFSNATDWNDPFVNSIGDTCSTSDLYNTCNFLGAFGVGVPANILGTEPARTGNGYAGIILSEQIAFFGCTSFGGSNWREYAMGRLASPLVAGQTYCVTFYVSLADNAKFATDDIGVHFSNTPFSVSCASAGNGPLPVTPQLVWAGGSLNNATGWTELQWSYVAMGGEQFITIGNFLNDGATSTTCENSSAINPYAYYYIDDVSVIQGTCGVLPVDLRYFEGERTDLGNNLYWETNAETNNHTFAVEKSQDGESWEAFKEMYSIGQDQGSQYELADASPYEKTWYRLTQTDFNGDQRILKTILLDREQTEPWQVTLSPNPSQGTLTMKVNQESKGTEILIYGTKGEIVWQKNIGELTPGQSVNLDAGQLPDGMYTIEIRSGVNVVRQRHVVLH